MQVDAYTQPHTNTHTHTHTHTLAVWTDGDVRGAVMLLHATSGDNREKSPEILNWYVAVNQFDDVWIWLWARSGPFIRYFYLTFSTVHPFLLLILTIHPMLLAVWTVYSLLVCILKIHSSVHFNHYPLHLVQYFNHICITLSNYLNKKYLSISFSL